MKIIHGTDDYDMFDTAKGSETIFARGDNDQFHINYDQLGAHSALNLMGQGGNDFFGVNGITADLLQPASSDQQVNIYGGKGHDYVDFYYPGAKATSTPRMSSIRRRFTTSNPWRSASLSPTVR